MSKKIHIAIGSTTSLPGQLDRNLGQIADFAKRAADDGADLLLTPELSASGYGGFPEVIAVAETAGKGPIYERLAKTSAATGVVIAAGFAELNGTKKHLSHYVVFPDGRFVVQRKHRVTEVERPLEPVAPIAPKVAGKENQPTELRFEFFEVKGVRCVVSICADAGITDINAYFAKQGVELLLGPTGAGGKREDRVTTEELYSEAGREKYLKNLEKVFFPGSGATDCIKYRRALAAVNMCGYDGKKHYHVGHGMIINPMGEVAGFFHGIPNIDRQRPMYAEGIVDVEDRLRSQS
ncbi:MAG: nitrilase-related carbon-nitrogen hydrolase [Victivallales bacterium]|jgi:predicted amidohydrolase